MEAHLQLSKRGYNVRSYGTATQVKLPGARADQPNVYEFGTPYNHIYDELKQRDSALYTQNGILTMLERNMAIKSAPERFIDALAHRPHAILCFEERCYDAVLEVLSERGSKINEPVHVFNMDVKDTHEDAVVGANCAVVFAEMLEKAEDLDDDVPQLLEQFEEKTGRQLLHSVMFY